MSGTTPNGLPYPDPTDPLAEGADAIKALAEALDPGVEQALITNAAPMIGAYDPAKRLTPFAARAGTAVGPTGICTVPLPPGITGVVAASAIVDGDAASGYYVHFMRSDSTVGLMAFQLYSHGTVSGALPVVGISVVGLAQFGASSKPAPDTDDTEPEATPQ